MDELLFEKGEIATITVNRPKALNALNPAVIQEMAKVLREVRREPSIRVLILTGAGDRAFIAGADIAAMSAMSTVEGMEFCRMGHRVTATFEELPIPVIAAVNGFALGGGTEMALACDLIVASEKARFGQPEINLGLIPGFGGTQRLPHRIGQSRARELILTGDMIDGKTAFEWGLANKLVAPDQLMAETRKLAEKLASKSGFALRQCKAALRASFTMNESEGLSYEQSAFGLTFASADKAEGTKAFVEKRDPKWSHR
ncbi:MAG TPA: enoyl-CoA hydratase-related protein [Candidatus Binataceae bacterium]|nr:enoyl-CoA hydratase-related protein [Candidatus Binataceae bacterium]